MTSTWTATYATVWKNNASNADTVRLALCDTLAAIVAPERLPNHHVFVPAFLVLLEQLEQLIGAINSEENFNQQRRTNSKTFH